MTDGFLRPDPAGWTPGPRWHAAVARAALSLQAYGAELEDLRVPVTWALTETYAGSISDEELVAMVAVMTPLTGLKSW